MPKYYLYARKSTDTEDKQVRSIEDQLNVLRKLAKEENIEISEEFVERRSAKTPGRVIFNEMLAKLQSKQASGILCWKLDRLARNPVDAAQVQWLLQENTIDHIRTYERSYYPSDNVMMMNMEFGIANQYIRDLSANTKRGLYEKARRGIYPCLAPIGYLNDLRNKTIIVDKHKAPIIKATFQRYSEDRSTLVDIAVFLFAQGIHTKKIQRINSTGNKPMKRDQVSYILSNPFYAGLFRYGGELHEGKHQPLISKQLFDQVQAILKKRSNLKSSSSNPKPLCGLFTCGECGRSITAETKTKHQKNGNTHEYLYYRCTKKNTNCSQSFIRGEVLDEQLSIALKEFVLPKDWAKELTIMADKDELEANQSTVELTQRLKSKIESINQKLEYLFEMYLNQDIEREKYLKEKNALVSEKKSFEEKITDFEQNQNSWLEPLREWLKYAQTVNEIAISPDLNMKKSAAKKIFGSNLYLRNKEIEFTPEKQWAALAAARESFYENPECFNLVGRVGFEPTTN